MRLKLLSVCPSSGPTGPADTYNDFVGNNAVGTVVTFTCSSDDITIFTSQCQANGVWTTAVGTCPPVGKYNKN